MYTTAAVISSYHGLALGFVLAIAALKAPAVQAAAIAGLAACVCVGARILQAEEHRCRR